MGTKEDQMNAKEWAIDARQCEGEEAKRASVYMALSELEDSDINIGRRIALAFDTPHADPTIDRAIDALDAGDEDLAARCLAAAFKAMA